MSLQATHLTHKPALYRIPPNAESEAAAGVNLENDNDPLIPERSRTLANLTRGPHNEVSYDNPSVRVDGSDATINFSTPVSYPSDKKPSIKHICEALHLPTPSIFGSRKEGSKLPGQAFVSLRQRAYFRSNLIDIQERRNAQSGAPTVTRSGEIGSGFDSSKLSDEEKTAIKTENCSLYTQEVLDACGTITIHKDPKKAQENRFTRSTNDTLRLINTGVLHDAKIVQAALRTKIDILKSEAQTNEGIIATDKAQEVRLEAQKAEKNANEAMQLQKTAFEEFQRASADFFTLAKATLDKSKEAQSHWSEKSSSNASSTLSTIADNTKKLNQISADLNKKTEKLAEASLTAKEATQAAINADNVVKSLEFARILALKGLDDSDGSIPASSHIYPAFPIQERQKALNPNTVDLINAHFAALKILATEEVRAFVQLDLEQIRGADMLTERVLKLTNTPGIMAILSEDTNNYAKIIEAANRLDTAANPAESNRVDERAATA